MHIGEDAESVGDKSHAENRKNAPQYGDAFSDAKADDDGAESGKNPL